MADQTKIEWTDFTVNFWEGCQKVGPGCDHCYAEARDARFTGGKHWGPGAPRRKVKGGIAKLRKIYRDAATFREAHGHWPRVFCSSLSDVFDNAVDPAWQGEAFAEMALATDTRIQLLTKRVGNVEKMVPDHWRRGGWPSHVGLSMEPLLCPVDLLPYLFIYTHDDDAALSCGCRDDPLPFHDPATTPPEDISTPRLDWVIVGGESGRGARPMHPDWARALRDQCVAAGVPFFFKQWGQWGPCDHLSDEVDGWQFGCFNDAGEWAYPVDQDFASCCSTILFHAGKRDTGRLLDGLEWNEVPE